MPSTPLKEGGCPHEQMPVGGNGHRWCMAVVSSCRETYTRDLGERSPMRNPTHNGGTPPCTDRRAIPWEVVNESSWMPIPPLSPIALEINGLKDELRRCNGPSKRLGPSKKALGGVEGATLPYPSLGPSKKALGGVAQQPHRLRELRSPTPRCKASRSAQDRRSHPILFPKRRLVIGPVLGDGSSRGGIRPHLGPSLMLGPSSKALGGGECPLGPSNAN